MADFLSGLSESRDRITKLLNKGSDVTDVNDALSAVAAGRSSYGEALNAARAKTIQNEMGLYGLLEKEQAHSQAAEERKLTREQTAADREATRAQQKYLAEIADQTRRDIAEMRTAGTGGHPAAPIQNFAHREKLVEKFGEDSPQVKRFDNYVRATQQANLNDRVAIIDPINPATPAAELPKGVPPQDTPATRGAQKSATAAAESLQKKKDNMPKAQTALSQWERKVKTVTDNVDKALALAEKSSTATNWGNYLAALPNTDARALNNYLDTIKANLGFDELQKMRDASPTGGALGQVSEFENRLLQAVQAALDPKQKDQLIENLKIIKQLYPQVLDDRKKAFAADFRDVVSNIAPGASVAPAGVDAAIWNAMTPEERALWQ